MRGHVRADNSSGITVFYRDQQNPESVTAEFDAFAGSRFGGDRFALSNSNQSYGPHYFDNVVVSTQAVPEPASMAALGIGALLFIRRRKR